MKREIKFRAWDDGRRKYIYSDRHLSLTTFFINIDRRNIMFNLEQFTGLHDKNKKEIYEGDILDCGQDPNAEVFWDQELGQWSISTYHAILSLYNNLLNAKVKEINMKIQNY